MHDIEPFFRWRDDYIASEDRRSPFYERTYDEFRFTRKVYNYYIHPQWDFFGSSTLYCKVLFASYDEGFAVIEMIGEWNDTLHNDVMFLKREVIEPMMDAGISKFMLCCENVLNFHGSDDCYYEEWAEEARDEGGWICFLNVLEHVEDEMAATGLQHYVFFGDIFNAVNWRTQSPLRLFEGIEAVVLRGTHMLR